MALAPQRAIRKRSAPKLTADQRLELKWKRRLHKGLFDREKSYDDECLQHGLFTLGIYITLGVYAKDVEPGVMNAIVRDPRRTSEKMRLVEDLIKCHDAAMDDVWKYNNNRANTYNSERRKHEQEIVRLIQACQQTEVPLRFEEGRDSDDVEVFNDMGRGHGIIRLFRLQEDGDFSATVQIYMNRGGQPHLMHLHGEINMSVPFTSAFRVMPNQFFLKDWRFFVPPFVNEMMVNMTCNFNDFNVWNVMNPKTRQRRKSAMLPRFIMEMILLYLPKVTYDAVEIPPLETLRRSGETYYPRQKQIPVWKTARF